MHRRFLVLLHGLLLAVRANAAAAKLTSLPTQTRTTPHLHAITTRAFAQYAGDDIFRRDTTEADLITCGYLDGNADFPRTAQPGFDCRVDTSHGIWGFCPSTVIAATDCGLAAACRDSGTCSSICRFNAASGLTTITCPSSGTNTAYCSTAMLTFGVDQSFGYIACGPSPKTENYIITPTFTPSTTSTSTTTTSTTSTTSTTPTTPTPTTPTTPTTSKTSTTSTLSPKTTSSTSPSFSATSSKIDSEKTEGQTNTATATATAGSQSPGTVVTQTNNQQTTSSSNLGPIVGGVLGGLALLCGSAIAVVFLMRKNRSNADARKKDDPSPTMSSATPFQPAPPYAPSPYPHGATPPPRPPQPPQTQLYPQVYYEADATSEKYKSSFDHSSQGGYPAYAVELPTTNHF